MVTAAPVVPPEVGVKKVVPVRGAREQQRDRAAGVGDRVAELVLDLDGEGADAGGGADRLVARDGRGEHQLGGRPRSDCEGVRLYGGQEVSVVSVAVMV